MNSKLLCLAAALSVATPAVAVDVDPDAFASGTDISTAYAGVTLRTVRTGADVNNIQSVGSVFAVTDPYATTGNNAFGQTASDTTWGNGSFEYLEAIFDLPVFFVSLDFFANDSSDSNPQLLAFDIGGTQIDISPAIGAVPLGSPVTLSVSGGGIKSVRAYWDELTRFDNGGLDHLVYTTTAVPEADVWALMILGFGAVGAQLRRRTSARLCRAA